jgi:hypothetical protein
MSFLLAILAIVIKNALYLQIVAFHEFFELLIFFSIEDFLNFFNTFVELILIISYNNDMKRLIVLKDVLGLLISASSSDTYLASGSLLDQFLGSTAWTYDLTYIIGLVIIDGII